MPRAILPTALLVCVFTPKGLQTKAQGRASAPRVTIAPAAIW
jgi:hypothetical protein